MTRLLLLFICLMCSTVLLGQSRNIDGIAPRQIWDVGHSFSTYGEKNFLALYPENITALPENIKALIAAFAVFAPVDAHDKNTLAKLVGYPTLEEANQKLAAKWITSLSDISRELFFQSLSIVQLDNNIFFLDGDDNVLVFEESKDHKITLKEQYNSSAINRLEAPIDRQARLKYEKSARASSDKGVVINGLKWATRNVGAPGKFADSPVHYGRHYQFNRKTGWYAYSDESWDATVPEEDSWEKANDPCPVGWRVPSTEELKTLLDTTKVDNSYAELDGVSGVKFTDKQTQKSIFLPYAGYRRWEDGRFREGSGWYYSSQRSQPQETDCTGAPECRYVDFLYLSSPRYAYMGRNSPSLVLSVRCVAE
ncbi:MAG: FISUMP domain-containing protein [Flavobacterium sp.]|nr:FISUMP domain-containing protein [Flavobacterium sp.]